MRKYVSGLLICAIVTIVGLLAAWMVMSATSGSSHASAAANHWATFPDTALAGIAGTPLSTCGPGPCMALAVKSGGVCSEMVCEVPAGGSFTLSVEIVEGPAIGFIWAVSEIDFGNALIYNPAPNPVEEIVWPDCYSPEVNRFQPNTTTVIHSYTVVAVIDTTVTNTNDSGVGSLRQAILNANSNVGVVDTIVFDIPGTGTHTIQPTSALPTITDPVIIDGYTQPGASPNTNGPLLGSNGILKIELDGTNAGGPFVPG